MPTEALTILAIEDDPGDAEMLSRDLDNISMFDVTFIRVGSPSEAKKFLASNEVDVIFLDHLLGAETGLQLIEQLRAGGELRPIIAMTGQGDEYLVRDLMRKGADDYLVKGDISPEVLRRSIENTISRFHRRQLENMNAQLAQDLKKKNATLEQKNRRLAELYETAHEFVDNVSHEFRTPLTVIKEFTSIINDGLVGDVSTEQQEYFGTVLDRVDDLATMIDDMLDISKLEAGLLGTARKVCTVGDILERVQKTLERKAASNRITLVFPDVESLPSLYCDAEKIGRVIINLTINAIKFSDEGSKISLWVKDEANAGMVRIGVTDNGPGIDPEKVVEIFERFQQLEGEIRSSTKGFGLGLNIARELVHLNFGDIEVTSEMGEGSTFSFTVPSADPMKLIHRYLDRIEIFRNGSSYVSLIGGSVDGQINESERSDVERFIQHQIRKSDLLFSDSSDGWVVVAATNETELSSLIQRIDRAHADANRNRPGAPLPKIKLKVKGTWALHDQREVFIESLKHELSPGEVMHA